MQVIKAIDYSTNGRVLYWDGNQWTDNVYYAIQCQDPGSYILNIENEDINKYDQIEYSEYEDEIRNE